jgi:peroxiredoxin Q/BCP
MKNSPCQLVTATLLFLFLVTSVVAQTKPYPKPQMAAAVGQIAPDFNLKDQDGKEFKLSEQRGHWVLLYFYRGYW